jgi:hypothetical protein
MSQKMNLENLKTNLRDFSLVLSRVILLQTMKTIMILTLSLGHSWTKASLMQIKNTAQMEKMLRITLRISILMLITTKVQQNWKIQVPIRLLIP